VKGTMTEGSAENSNKEKRKAAFSSIIAAVGLTGMKLVVGMLTGSLGILAEAAHSALDLVAAVVTYFAVRISDMPADPEHPYGHGKVENLSALFETLLLLATCVWIFKEAAERLFYKTVHVDAGIWAFLVMAISIVVDISRSRMLSRAAHKHHSQALEADALHFSTDIWSSAVVILGLAGVLAAGRFPRWVFLEKADAVAAAFVAFIVVYISIRMGIRALKPLVDAAPPGLADDITKVVEKIPGIVNCHNVRVRNSGAHVFVDAHVLVDGRQTLEQAHALTEAVEAAVRSIEPEADVTVHPEPAEPSPDK
jgi:cation diffusion facilitator family transporter